MLRLLEKYNLHFIVWFKWKKILGVVKSRAGRVVSPSKEVMRGDHGS